MRFPDSHGRILVFVLIAMNAIRTRKTCKMISSSEDVAISIEPKKTASADDSSSASKESRDAGKPFPENGWFCSDIERIEDKHER